MSLSMRVTAAVALVIGVLGRAPVFAAATVQTFESFPENTVLTTQIPGLTISAPGGTPLIREASTPLVPGEPKGLAHIPYDDFPAFLNIDFAPGTNTVGALIDFGVVGSGVGLTAYAGPGQTGGVLGTTSTTTESFLSLSAAGIRSARFETLSANASYLIDNLTYELVPEPATIGGLCLGMLLLVGSGTRNRMYSRNT
ncbi:MAG: PEP-CTERM sorting domain-containing protein [Pirellulales bacterium]